jgi:hypothetical protein
MNSLVRTALFVLLVVLAGSFAQAQLDQLGQLGAGAQSQFLSATSVQLTTSNYYYAKPNELTIIVNIMGFVQRPGRYEISKSIDLVNLLALAGGANPDGSLSDVKITRLLEAEGRITRGEFKMDLSDMTNVKSADLALSPGDVIEVGRSSWPFWRDAFTVVVAAAVVVSAVSQVIIAKHY